MLFYGHPYTEMTEKKLRVYQLAITALAATVGIGTVANASKSARISAESIELTREKEIREQSSHLVPVSPSGEFLLAMPNNIDDKSRYNFSDLESSRFSLIPAAEEERNNRLNSNQMSNIEIKTLNVGKGSCVNLEYKFKIANLNEFHNYEYSSMTENHSSNHALQYVLGMRYNEENEDEKSLSLSFNDISIFRALSLIGLSSKSTREFSESSFIIEDRPFTKFIDFIKPQSEISLPLPAGFIILCKQYLLAKDKMFNIELKDNRISDVPVHQPIPPIGYFSISYHDESLIRLGELSPEKKTTFEYIVHLKDTKDRDDLSKLSYYLEINHFSSKRT